MTILVRAILLKPIDFCFLDNSNRCGKKMLWFYLICIYLLCVCVCVCWGMGVGRLVGDVASF